MLYGALPGTVTGKLSVPHQNPGGPSPSGNCSAAVTVRLVPAVTLAPATPPLVRASAMHAARASHGLVIMPPRLDVRTPELTAPSGCWSGRTGSAPRAGWRMPA